MPTIVSQYEERIEELENQKANLSKHSTLLMWLRLCFFLAALLSFFFLFGTTVAGAIAVAILFLTAFGIAATADIRNQKRINDCIALITINKNEVDGIEGRFSAFKSGKEFFDVHHPYTYDLDIFGENSIFQMICRASTQHGQQSLAKRLSIHTELNEIPATQEAANELSNLVEWRQQFQVAGQSACSKNADLTSLSEWLETEDENAIKTPLKLFVLLYPLVSIGLLTGTIFGLSSLFFVFSLLPHFIFYGKYGIIATKLQQKTGSVDDELKAYSKLLNVIEQHDFSSDKLKSLKTELLYQNKKPSSVIGEFARLVKKLDHRNNVAFMLTIGFLVFWDLRISLELFKWKKRYGSCIRKWMETVGEYEAISSLATLKYNNPDWCFPIVKNDYFSMHADEIGHPLIPVVQRVTNNFGIEHIETILLTGSNMAGKSTFLRTIGVNMVLAYAGAPVCAKKFETSYVPIRTSMRITDSLIENTSSFYAEIKRLGEIVEAIKKGEKPFLLLDEILRGTNSNDRHIGSKALIDLLVENAVCGIIATHDLALSEAQQTYPNNLSNYNFDVQVDSNDELYFDYKVKPGVCKSLNASILMRKIGLKV